MEKVPGCWEDMSVVWDKLKSRKTGKSNIATIWLDVSNAYGSVLHKLLVFCPWDIWYSRTLGVFAY